MLHWLFHEIGLAPVWHSSRDIKLLFLQRFARMVAFGASSLILALYLSDLGFKDELIGLFMSLTLIGDVLISFLLTLFADALGRKNILVAGSLLMSLSGLAFSLSDNFWLLLVAATFGVIAPSGSEIGPFRAIEESILAQLCDKKHRSDVFTWYTLLGILGAAMGQIGFGWMIEHLSRTSCTKVQAYRLTFMAYAIFGLVKLLLALLLSSSSEQVQEHVAMPQGEQTTAGNDDDPTRPLLSQPSEPHSTENTPNGQTRQPSDSDQPSTKPKLRRLVPSISQESRSILYKLCLLFAIDSFATGLVTVSWIAVFFGDKFNLASGALGTLFFVTSVVAAFSNLISASLARRIGLIKTMVFTHLPSSIFLALIPVPDSKWLAMGFMTLRACSMTMDTAPRQAFLAAAVLDSERTAVMGFVNVVRTLSQSAGPYTTGALRAAGKFWITFVLAGCLKSSYDFGLLALFLRFKERA